MAILSGKADLEWGSLSLRNEEIVGKVKGHAISQE